MRNDKFTLLQYAQLLRAVAAGKDIPDEARDRMLELGLIDWKFGKPGLRVKAVGQLIIEAADTVLSYMERAEEADNANG